MELPKRKTIRLENYNYTQNGAYFVTICTHNRVNLFGEIAEQKVFNKSINVDKEQGELPKGKREQAEVFFLPKTNLSKSGAIIDQYINSISLKYSSMKIDKYIIMPNHIHMIITLEYRQNNKFGTGNPSPTLGNIVGWFKYQTTKTINEIKNSPGEKLWQRSYYDHVIRSEGEYAEIWEYIHTNTLKWQEDCYFIPTSSEKI